jgi:hypothetical protein
MSNFAYEGSGFWESIENYNRAALETCTSRRNATERDHIDPEISQMKGTHGRIDSGV